MTEFPPVPGQLDLLQELGTPTEASDPAIDQRQPAPQSKPNDFPDRQQSQPAVGPLSDARNERGEAPEPVSYTHLTLPTIVDV